MTDIKDQTQYPENPPWTMFFDGPLYEKYKEFMANKDFSQILLTTKLKMANQSNTEPSVSEFGGGMGWWIPGQEGIEKPVNQFAGDEYNTVSDDFYRKFTRGKKEEKRRTRRTRAILLLIILVLLTVSLGTALIIHYFFIPTDQDEAPAQVNISFSGNTSIFDMTTVTSEDADKADTESSINEILEAIQADTHRPEPDTMGDEVRPEDRLMKDVTPRSTPSSNDSGATTSQFTSTNTTSTTHRITTAFIDPMDFFGMDENFTTTQAVQTTTEGTADATTNETTLPSSTTVSTPESSTGPVKGTVFTSVTSDTTTVGKVTETELQGQEGRPLVTMASTVAVSSESSTTTLSTTAVETTTRNDSFPTTIYEPTTHVSRTAMEGTTGNVLGTSVVTTTTVSERTTKPMPSTSAYPTTTTTESFTTPDLTDTSTTDVPMFETTTEDMFTEQTTVIEEATTTNTNVIRSTVTTLGQTIVPPFRDATSATPTESTTTTLIENTTTPESSSTTSSASSTVHTSPSSTSFTFSVVLSASTNAPSVTSPSSQTVTTSTLNTDTSVSVSTTSDGFSSNTTAAETSLRTEPSTVTAATIASESPTTATTSFTSTTTSALNTSSPSNAPITKTSTTMAQGTPTSTTMAQGTTTSTTMAPGTTTSTTIAPGTTTSPITTNTTTSLETTEPSTASATTVSSNTTSTDASFTREHDTTIAETTQTTTTPTPETTTEVLPQMTMEGSTTYTSETAEMKCRVTDLGRFESLSISEVKHFAVVKVTLYSNGTVKWSYSKTRRHDVKFEFTNTTGNYLRELKLSMWITNVQCKDAGSFVCDLKTRAHEVTNSAKLVVVGRPDNKIQLKIGPSIVEDRAVRLTAIWQGGYPIPWTNMSWTAYDTNNNSYNLADYGDYRDYKLREDHLRCETFLESSIVIFPKIHLNDTTVIVKPGLETTRSFLDHTMKEYLTTVEYGVQKILVIPLNYCQNGSKEVSIPHPYTECSKFIWCLPGDLVVQQCPGGTCFDEGWEECI